MLFLNCAGNYLDLSSPQVMGIINMTPESRYGAGQVRYSDQVLFRAEQMVKEGAAIIDIGGESTRPGATPVSLQEELDRVIPLIEACCRNLPVIISVDTMKPEIMREAIRVGVGLINDVKALRAEGALNIVANSNVAVCLMHMQGEPQTMQQNPHYDDVVFEIKNFLSERINSCLKAGIAQESLLIDHGVGFGKNFVHNMRLLNKLQQFCE